MIFGVPPAPPCKGSVLLGDGAKIRPLARPEPIAQPAERLLDQILGLVCFGGLRLLFFSITVLYDQAGKIARYAAEEAIEQVHDLLPIEAPLGGQNPLVKRGAAVHANSVGPNRRRERRGAITNPIVDLLGLDAAAHQYRPEGIHLCAGIDAV